MTGDMIQGHAKTHVRIRRRALAAALLAVAVGTAAPARAGQVVLAPDVLGALSGAATELLFVTPALRSRELADALRRAAHERGVRVYLLTDARYVQEPAGFAPGLSLLPGVQVRLLRGLTFSRVVVDRRVSLGGPLLGSAGVATGAPSLREDSPAQVRDASVWFARAWAAAQPYTYAPQLTRAPTSQGRRAAPPASSPRSPGP